ncbi:hypothetical protein ED733_006198 [Metarhizium rileyi]|uniref:Uncharacterized protein n=1 Tax=Metarhizium rileyi (strain RCEF 4871) TaxID=1649241 RepID=A0A5C6GFS5_METRR|nr:hypothetical protein ED733_006198 [Metarhizium rileyi]
MAPKHSSRSRLWLSSTRRQRHIFPAVIRGGDDSYQVLSPLTSVKSGVSKASSAKSLHAYEKCTEDAVGKRPVDAGSVIITRLSDMPTTEQDRVRAGRNSPHVAGPYEQRMGNKWQLSKRSFSPFSDSAVAMMPDGHLEPLVVTPSLGQHDAWTRSVQLLINETADAFEAVPKDTDGSNLTSWLLDLPEVTNTASAPETSACFIPPQTINDHDHDHDQEQEVRETSNQSSLHKGIKSAVDKPLPQFPKSQQMQKLKKGRRKATQSHVLRSTKPSKWTVPSGVVAQFLTSTRFRRVQADEMLTPEKIEEMRVKRAIQNQQPSPITGRNSSDSSDSTLSQQTTALSVKSSDSSSGSAAEKPSVLPLDDAVVHADFSLPGPSTTKTPSPRARSNSDTIVLTSDICSLSPPPKNPQRYAFTNIKARLPTIPEVVADRPEETAGRPSTDHSLRSQDSDDFVYPPATPLSAANSSFKHGHIACQVAGSQVNLDEEMDDTIDSSAYQIAIQGLPGNDLQATMAYEDDENDLADDMTAWFSTFGFETHGELIPGGACSPWSLSSNSVISTSPSSINEDPEALVPVSLEDNYPFAKPIRFFRSHAPPKRWTPEEASFKRNTLRNAQYQSYRLRTAPLVVGDGGRDCISERVVESADLSLSMKQDITALLKWMAARGE